MAQDFQVFDCDSFLAGDFFRGVIAIVGLGGMDNIGEIVLGRKTAKDFGISHVTYNGMTPSLVDRVEGVVAADETVNLVSGRSKDFQNRTAYNSSRSG